MVEGRPEQLDIVLAAGAAPQAEHVEAVLEDEEEFEPTEAEEVLDQEIEDELDAPMDYEQPEVQVDWDIA